MVRIATFSLKLKMKIAFDISAISGSNSLQHRVRGVGSYTQNLKNALEKHFPNNLYTFFDRRKVLPNDIDLVHYTYFEPFFLTLPLIKKIPIIVTVHDLIPLIFPEQFPSGIKGRIKWQIQKFSLKSCEAIITDSQSSKRDIVRLTGINENKIHVVYLAAGEEFKIIPARIATQGVAGGDAGDWKMDIRSKYKLPERFALYVGDVTWNKNLPNIIRAANTAKIPLVMVGKALVDKEYDKSNSWNQDRIFVEKLTKDNPLIFKLGFVATEDLVKIYNLAETLLMPSLYEGFGLPVLEAMSCGCPVITSKKGSLEEVAGEAGIYVNPENIKEISDKLLWLLNFSKEEREEIIKKGLLQAKKFSWKKTALETVKIYEKFF